MGLSNRLYYPLIQSHLANYRQMLFLMGPRQVGKTTLCLSLDGQGPFSFTYLNWDNLTHRDTLIQSPLAIAQELDKIRGKPPLVGFDEIHKYPNWKTLLKEFFDTYAHTGEVKILVTGSARLDLYKAGGDSLMGRYFPYRIHPFSCAELLERPLHEGTISPPQHLDESLYQALLKFGGFPEPLFKQEASFYKRWKQLRFQQLFNADLRDLTRIHDVKQIELLAELLRQQIGSLVSYTSLAKRVRVSVETIRRWMEILRLLYYCYSITPWSRNVSRSPVKEPKTYLWDWSFVDDTGARAENMIASHLLKACHYWTDRGQGQYSLHFLRDKQKRKVDFVIAKKPRTLDAG